MIQRWVLLVVFGAIGTVARAEGSAWVQRLSGSTFPWGTVFVNLLGSFAFGFVWSVTAGGARTAELRTAALTGFMGAFTTFSTFMFDGSQLAQASRYGALAGNLILQNGAGLALMFAGLALGRAL
ncbi:MAG TPA: CrcB family protein [Polyangiaceae bacterium]|nr:CrcB family protein [Polyangiaceae bacterium]